MKDLLTIWRDLPIVVKALCIAIWAATGVYLYRVTHHLDVPTEARAYCNALGMVAHDASAARRDGRQGETAHLHALRRDMGGPLPRDVQRVVAEAFATTLAQPAAFEDAILGKCVRMFRQNGKQLPRDGGQVFG